MDIKLLKFTKAQKSLMKWILAATSRDSARPILGSVNLTDDAAVSADGFVLHVITPNPFDEMTGNPKIVKIGSEYAEQVPLEGTYPDYKKVLPTREPTIRLYVNPRLLARTLQDIDSDMATISLYDPFSPLMIEWNTFDEKRNYHCTAIVMPMQGEKPIPTQAQIQAKKMASKKRKPDKSVG